MSVFDFSSVGASLSLRSFSRFGSTMSIFGTLALGGDTLQFTTASGAIYGRKSDGTYRRAMSFPDATYSGVLHGEWQADTVVGTSDRRLKTNIAPLHQTLLSHMSRAQGTTPSKIAQEADLKHISGNETNSTDNETSFIGGNRGGSAKQGRRDAIEWVLRELRPVSFTFRQGADAKSMNRHGQQRFGFVAQEVEKVVPDLVRDTGATKSMVYQDLIAMITLATQDHQERIEQHNGEVGKLRSLVQRLGEKLGHLQKRVARVIAPLEQGRHA
jgi:hypothetical protein